MTASRRPDRLRLIWEGLHQSGSPAAPNPRLLKRLENLSSLLPAGSSALDAGCGKGQYLAHLHRCGFRAAGCDISTNALGKARRQLDQSRATAVLLQADLRRLPLMDDSFALVICVHTLPYFTFAGLTRATEELYRVLRPGGWVCFDLLDLEDSAYGCGPELEEHTFLDPKGLPVHFSTAPEIEALFPEADGLELKKRQLAGTSGRISWEVWAKKRLKPG